MADLKQEIRELAQIRKRARRYKRAPKVGEEVKKIAELEDEIARLRVVEKLYKEACDAAYDRGALLARIGELEALARDVLEGCRAADLMNAEPYGKAHLWERLNKAVNTAMRLEMHDAIRGDRLSSTVAGSPDA